LNRVLAADPTIPTRLLRRFVQAPTAGSEGLASAGVAVLPRWCWCWRHCRAQLREWVTVCCLEWDQRLRAVITGSGCLSRPRSTRLLLKWSDDFFSLISLLCSREQMACLPACLPGWYMMLRGEVYDLTSRGNLCCRCYYCIVKAALRYLG